MNQLITISCYFGELPEHFPEFIHSVALNPTIDFLLITDNRIEELPENVKLHHCSFCEMKQRLQKLFDFPIVLDRPYKLCDYKPVWGLAFPEYIQGYDFWGYCDIDLIFGDIRKFLPDVVLDKYDKIYKLGHLTYYRNTEINNTRYQLNGGVCYKDAFTTSKITSFDEIAGMQNIYDRHGFPTYFSRDYADITYGKVRFTLSYFHIPEELVKENNFEKQVFYWENGRVFRAYLKNGVICRDEFIYIHFSKRRMIRNDLPENCAAFFITNKGLYKKTGEVCEEDFDRYNRSEPVLEMVRKVECWWRRFTKIFEYYQGILQKKYVQQLIRRK